MTNILVVLFFFPAGLAFILGNDPCPSPSPCRCYGSTIQCGYQRIHVFPSFNFNNFSRNHYRSMEIDLHRNSLTSIPMNALSNIINVQPDKLTINLEENNISIIDDHAFSNLANISVTLVLSKNNLNQLPHALSYIPNLNTLRVLDNSFVYLDGTVLTSIGKSLETLWIDMSSVPIWPREFVHFSKLNELLVENLPFESLPSDSFEGMTSLTRLEISHSKLHTVPEAICSLHSLVQLDFHHNTYLVHSPQNILTHCPNPLDKVSLVYLNYNNMYTFPRYIFDIFPKLLTLGLNFNNIENVEESVIPSHSPLYYLYMSNNRLTQIPPAVSNFHGLLTLVVSHNQIKSVDGHVLSSLTHLRQLTISYNPLTHIDPHAFSTSYTMRDMYMENTNLTSIPVAVLHSADRSSVQLMGSPVECSCSSMAFLHAIPVSDVQTGKKFIHGNCANMNSSLKSYIVNVLPTCL